jgi:hypothetical protein
MIVSEEEGPLTRRLRKLDPTWWWLRAHFPLPSLATIGGVFVTAGLWIWSQHADLQDLKKHDPTPALAQISTQLSAVLETQAAMKQQLADFGRRIDEQDHKWERVEEAAEIRIPRKRGGFR